MRVTFVLPYADLSGGIRVPTIYAQNLIRRGHSVQVVSVPPRRPTVLQCIKSCVRGRGWPRAAPAEGSYLDKTEVPHHVLKRWRPITDRDVPDADVVVGTWWETLEWVAAMNAAKGAKVSFIQGYDPFFYQDRSPQLLARSMATWRLPAHKIIISRWLVELARTQFGDVTASHVPNSVDTVQFQARPRGRQSLPTVGLLYSTPHCKGVDVSLKAFSIAAQKIQGLKLVAFGREQPGGAFPLPTGTTFTLRPPQESIKNLYAACDVWLCGSRCEGFHLAPLEAMACRCPVVSTKVGGPMDIISEGRNGHLVEIEDAEVLADRLIRVLTLPEEDWQKMSDAAYATAHEYTWNDATDRFEAALQLAITRSDQSKAGTSFTANIRAFV